MDRTDALVTRKTSGLMRFALGVGVVLTGAAGAQLFVLTDRTEEYFAWTIGVGASAAFLGAFFWAAAVMAYVSWRRREWARARVGLPGVTVFLWATLATTLLHLDAFHLTDGPGTARVAAWGWLIAYSLDPVLVTSALIAQRRVPGVDSARTTRLHRAHAFGLWAAGIVLAGLGLVMVVAPAAAPGLWPWPLTDLTSRALGAWVLGAGGVLVTMAWENDRDRIRPATVALLTLGPLLAVGLLRYRAEFDGTAAVVGYLVAVAVLTLLGAAGWLGEPPRRAGGVSS